ncbi:MAG: glycosyltransferase family 2 protein [Acidobacteriaceae bacterium]
MALTDGLTPPVDLMKPMITAPEIKPVLTIAIPTYNRASFLKELLTSLFEQLVGEQRVELVICDNASPDTTPLVIAEFQRRGLAVRSIRNRENIGPDANFLACFEQARSTYVWIFGDDDIIVPGGVAAVLDVLEAKEYDLIHLGSFPIQGTPPAAHRQLRVKEFERAAPFVKRVHINFTFISGNIVNKDRVLAGGADEFATGIGTNLVQLTWIYSALNNFSRGLLIEDRLVGARVDNTGGYKLTEVFGAKLKGVTERWLHSRQLQRLILRGTVQRFWPGMLLFYRRSSGTFESDAAPARTLTDTFRGDPRYWFFVYPILILPTPLGSAWFFFVRVLNRVDKACGFVL